jgi:hypothetical protein
VNNKIIIIQSNNPHKNILEEELTELSPMLIENAIKKNIDNTNYSINYVKNKTNSLLKTITPITSQVLIKYTKKSGKYENISTPFNKFMEWMVQNETDESNEIFYLENGNSQLLKQLELYDKFNEFAQYYLQPLSIKSNYFISIGNKYVQSKLKQVNNKRLIICQMKGSSTFYLFNPKQKKYLYPSSNYDNEENTSNVNFWKQDDKTNIKKYSEFNKSQYVEIILHEGYMFHIPNRWWYCYKNNATSISVSIKSETITDLIVKVPSLFK